jgi:hypothetical protein
MFAAADRRYGSGMSEIEPGVDRHDWETEYEALGDELRTEPAESLPELLDLVERMLEAHGFPLDGDIAEDAPEVEAAVGRARELVRRLGAGETVENDDAFQAAAELRGLYRSLISEPGAQDELEQAEEAAREDR